MQRTPELEEEQVAEPSSPYASEKEKGGSVADDHVSIPESQHDEKIPPSGQNLNPGSLSFEEGTFANSKSNYLSLIYHKKM